MPGRFDSLFKYVWKILLYRKEPHKNRKHRGWIWSKCNFWMLKYNIHKKKMTNHQYLAQWNSTKAMVQLTLDKEIE